MFSVDAFPTWREWAPAGSPARNDFWTATRARVDTEIGSAAIKEFIDDVHAPAGAPRRGRLGLATDVLKGRSRWRSD